MALTRAQQQAMDDLQRKVRGYLERVEGVARPVELAADYLGWVDDLPWGLPVFGAVKLAKELLTNDAQASAVGALREVADRVPRWIGPDGDHYRWAQRGTRDNGTRYELATWLAEGDAIASSLADILGEVHEASLLDDLQDTVSATEEEVMAAGRAVVDAVADTAGAIVGPWDWKVKAALWVGGGILATGAVSVGWQAIRATPLGLALRGVGAVARRGAEPLEDAARKAGQKARVAIERMEREQARAQPARPAKGKTS